MRSPIHKTRLALLAGLTTIVLAAPASASVTSSYSTDPDATLEVISDGADAISIVCDADNLVKVNGRDPVRGPTPGTTTDCRGPQAVVVNGGPDATR